MEKNYLYDVAFSFLAEDEIIAQNINDLLKGRVKTFIYSENQKVLAGKDGEKAFSEVFFENARIVVVLYRERWGSTTWTRIEETAIRNRAYDSGYDFTIFIPLEEKPSVPKWLPKTQLYVGLSRWGIEGAAGVIEAKIENFGGEIKNESYIDHANQIKKKQDLIISNEKLFGSEEGVKVAFEYAHSLINKIAEVVDLKIKDSIVLKNILKQENRIIYCSDKYFLDVKWFNRYINTISEGYLNVVITIGCPKITGYVVFDDPENIFENIYEFDRDLYGNFGWRNSDTKTFYTIDNLVKDIFEKYFEVIDKEIT